jgi:hypothetical protein
MKTMKTMKTKKTRPTTLTTIVRVRVTKAQHDALMNLAHSRNTTFSTYARKVLLKDIEDTYV